MKILITGAYGFVGTNLSSFLSAKDCDLIALDQHKKESNQNYSTFFYWNDFDKIDFDSIDTIIHLAGKAHDTKSQSEADLYFAINTELTKQVFDAFLNSKAKRFIFFSSVKAVADYVDGDVLTEDTTPKPVGPYAESKAKAEEYILSKKISEEKQIYILRPCMIHGPGNKGNLNLLHNIVSKGIPYPLAAFDNKRSFLSIENLCFIIQEIIENNVPSGVYNVADDVPLATNDLVRLISKALGKKPKLWRVPVNMIKGMGRLGNILHLPLNSERLSKLTENYVVDNFKIKRALGVDKMPVSAQEGLRKTIESFKR